MKVSRARPEIGQVFKLLKSGKLFEISKVKGQSVSGFYVDQIGRMLSPVVGADFTLDFLDNYAKSWRLDAPT